MFERKKPSGKLLSLPIDQIHPSPFQARKSFDEQELTALAQSIRENGLLQPVTVRKAAEGYELVAGERRLRACQLAKMTTISAILCSYADDRTAALGLLENIQRADLNPFEQAQGLRDVMVLWDCTQAEAAKRFRGGSYMDLDIDGLHCCPQLFQNLVVVGGVDGFRLGGGFKQFLNKGLPFLGGFGGIGRVSGGGGTFARNGSFQVFYGLSHRK